MKLVFMAREQWQHYSEHAHKISFGEIGYEKLDRCDYALMVVDDEKPLMYATIKELDAESAYLQRGGAMPETKGTANSYRTYEMILDYLKTNYKYISMRIENNNFPMLKFAMKSGFKIEGITYAKKKIYLDHFMEVSNVVDDTGCDSSIGRDECEQQGEATKGLQPSAS